MTREKPASEPDHNSSVGHDPDTSDREISPLAQIENFVDNILGESVNEETEGVTTSTTKRPGSPLYGVSKRLHTEAHTSEGSDQFTFTPAVVGVKLILCTSIHAKSNGTCL